MLCPSSLCSVNTQCVDFVLPDLDLILTLTLVLCLLEPLLPIMPDDIPEVPDVEEMLLEEEFPETDELPGTAELFDTDDCPDDGELVFDIEPEVAELLDDDGFGADESNIDEPGREALGKLMEDDLGCDTLELVGEFDLTLFE